MACSGMPTRRAAGESGESVGGARRALGAGSAGGWRMGAEPWIRVGRASRSGGRAAAGAEWCARRASNNGLMPPPDRQPHTAFSLEMVYRSEMHARPQGVAWVTHRHCRTNTKGCARRAAGRTAARAQSPVRPAAAHAGDGRSTHAQPWHAPPPMARGGGRAESVRARVSRPPSSSSACSDPRFPV